MTLPPLLPTIWAPSTPLGLMRLMVALVGLQVEYLLSKVLVTRSVSRVQIFGGDLEYLYIYNEIFWE